MSDAQRQEYQPPGSPQPINDVGGRTRQIVRNMRLALDEAGATAADSLKVTVFLTDVEDSTRINPVRQAFFGAARPASTLIGVKALAKPGFKVEIEAIVGLRGR